MHTWTIYGIVLFFSDESHGCWDESKIMLILMAILLVIGVLKLILFLVGLSVVIYVEILRRKLRRNQMNASVKIL